MGITAIGYMNLIDKIKQVAVFVPGGMTTDQLRAYLDGYSKCQNEILEIINEYKESSYDGIRSI